MSETNASARTRRGISALLLTATTMLASLAGALAPAACIPGGDEPDIGGMFDCDESDPCCVGGVCTDMTCDPGGGREGKCTFNGAILAGPSCGCAVVGGGVGGPGGGGGPGEIETMSDSAAEDPMRQFLEGLDAADFPPGGTEAEAEFFQGGCDDGLAQACVGLAILHAVKADSDLEAAALAAQQGCELGGAEACYLLGGAYATGSGVPMDEGTAEMLFGQSCDLGLELGCEGASSMAEGMARIEARLQ